MAAIADLSVKNAAKVQTVYAPVIARTFTRTVLRSRTTSRHHHAPMGTTRSPPWNTKFVHRCTAHGCGILTKLRSTPPLPNWSHYEPAPAPENVENNETRPLVGWNINGRTPLWQHDNSCIRLPTQFLRWLAGALQSLLLLTAELASPIFLGVRYLMSAIAEFPETICEYIPRPLATVIWFCLLATVIVNGSYLGIALSRKESTSVLLPVELASTFLWALLTSIVTKQREISGQR